MKAKNISISPSFEFGELVYLKASVGNDDLCMKGVVVRYYIDPPSVMLYAVTWADQSTSSHYDFELTNSKFPVEEEEEHD